MDESKYSEVSSDISQKRGPGRPLGSKNRCPSGSKNKATVIHQKEVKLELDNVSQEGLAMPNKKGPGRPPLIRTQAADIPKIANSKSSTKTATERTMRSRRTGALPETQHEALNIKRKELLVRSRPSMTNNLVVPEKRARRTPFFYGSGMVDILGKKDRQGQLSRRPAEKTKAEKKSGKQRKGLRVKKEASNAFAGQKRGRGRPRMSISWFAKIKPKSAQLSRENTKEVKRNAVRRKSLTDRRDYVTRKIKNDNKTTVGVKSIVQKARNVKSAKIASVTVLVEAKRRGRPRKVQPEKADQEQEQKRRGRPRKVKPEKADQEQEQKRRGRPRKVQPEKDDEEQVTQDMSSTSAEPHCSWVRGEIIEELDGGPETEEYQYSYCETKLLPSDWIPPQVEYDELGSPVTHWFVENSADSQVSQESPPPAEPAPGQSCHRDDFLHELSNLKCQLISELASTRAEMREGAQLVQSAITGVSAEIHRLGQILQPLVSAITGGRSPWQDPPEAFVPRPQQDTPPDDAMDVMEPSVQAKTSFPQQDQVFASLHSTPSNCSTIDVCSIKMEDASTSPPPCIHPTQSAVITQVDLSMDPMFDLSHQLKACLVKVTSSALDTSVNITQPNTNSIVGL